ncbi:hypothetical protein pb186bvf_003663 [Paramecium bursaria]
MQDLQELFKKLFNFCCTLRKGSQDSLNFKGYKKENEYHFQNQEMI